MLHILKIHVRTNLAKFPIKRITIIYNENMPLKLEKFAPNNIMEQTIRMYSLMLMPPFV